MTSLLTKHLDRLNSPEIQCSVVKQHHVHQAQFCEFCEFCKFCGIWGNVSFPNAIHQAPVI